LIDVVFILLVFFMLASSLIQWRVVALDAPASAASGTSAVGSWLVRVQSDGLDLNAETMEALLEDPYILVHEKKVSSLNDLLPLLQAVAKTAPSDVRTALTAPPKESPPDAKPRTQDHAAQPITEPNEPSAKQAHKKPAGPRSTASPPRSTGASTKRKAAAAPYANAPPEPPNDSRSITATAPASSADYSTPPATPKSSATSETTSKPCNEPSVICRTRRPSRPSEKGSCLTMTEPEPLTTAKIVVSRMIDAQGQMGFDIKTYGDASIIEYLGLLSAAQWDMYRDMTAAFGDNR
jgi:hypothetical protein